MNRCFVTYGDSGYELAQKKIIQEAKKTGEFNVFRAFNRKDISTELSLSNIINIKRGGGLWSWKPDVILKIMKELQQGDIIVYCDAGCSLYRSTEWLKIWKTIGKYDIIAQRLYQRTDKWTRRELTDYFVGNGESWLHQSQFLSTVIILVINDFTINFITEWRDIMLNHPELVYDVEDKSKKFQRSCFIENRHDQAVFSSLIYKYLNNGETKGLIYTQWEHIEDLDPFCKQAIRATRLRQGQEETQKQRNLKVFKRIVKDFIYTPFYYAPLQWWYSRNI